jgi:hypothetical protein
MDIILIAQRNALTPGPLPAFLSCARAVRIKRGTVALLHRSRLVEFQPIAFCRT